MKKEQDLHELIHSLTPAEKRYFKLYAKANIKRNKKVLETLFDSLNRWEGNYNETEFKQKHKNITSELEARTRYLLSIILANDFDRLDNILRTVQRFIKQHAINSEFHLNVVQLGKAILKTGSFNAQEVKEVNKIIQSSPEGDTYIKELINEYIERE